MNLTPCDHKRVYYVGLQPQEHPYPPLELATCLDCGSTISMGGKYTWYIRLSGKDLYIKNEEFESDRRLDI